MLKVQWLLTLGDGTGFFLRAEATWEQQLQKMWAAFKKQKRV